MNTNLNLVPMIKSLQKEMKMIEQAYQEEIEAYKEKLAQLRKLNTVCERCEGTGMIGDNVCRSCGGTRLNKEYNGGN